MPNHENSLHYFDDLNENGCVLNKRELEIRRKRRLRRGECVTCGQKCYEVEKHNFTNLVSLLQPKLVPITVDKKVEDGRCLVCYPHSENRRTVRKSTHSKNLSSSSFFINDTSQNINTSKLSTRSLPLPQIDDILDPMTEVSRIFEESPVTNHSKITTKPLTPSFYDSPGPITEVSPDIVESSSSDFILDTIFLMAANRDDAKIQHDCIERLSLRLDTEEEISHIAFDRIGIQLISRAIVTFPEHSEIAKNSCIALWKLSMHPPNRDEIHKIDISEELIATMDSHSDDLQFQIAVALLLSIVVHNDEERKRNAVDKGVLDPITFAMVCHSSSSELQSTSCLLLKELACTPNIQLMLVSGVHEIVITAENSFPNECSKNSRFVLDKINQYLATEEV